MIDLPNHPDMAPDFPFSVYKKAGRTPPKGAAASVLFHIEKFDTFYVSRETFLNFKIHYLS